MAVAGKNGKVVVGASASKKVVGIKNWSLELSLDTLETTALGDDWKNYITGLKEWSASSEGDYEVPVDTEGQKALQDAFLNGTTVTVKLYVDGTKLLSGRGLHKQPFPLKIPLTTLCLSASNSRERVR